MDAEKNLRKRIRRILSLAGLDQTLSGIAFKEVENRILSLFREYNEAPEELKEEAYAMGEERILEVLKEAEPVRHGFPQSGSSSAGGSRMR